MLYCSQHIISVTPCGARTGLSGGSLPVCGGVVLSTERFNRIIEIDERNLQATVEPGVINQIFQEAVQGKGLYYPPDPASKEVVSGWQFSRKLGRTQSAEVWRNKRLCT